MKNYNSASIEEHRKIEHENNICINILRNNYCKSYIRFQIKNIPIC